MPTNNSANMSTTGMLALTSTGSIIGRTITGTTNQITITNGDGTSANPTLSFPSPATFTATQPMVLANLSATTGAVTGDATVYTVIFDNEITDAGTNYNNSTGVFTAPVAGNYLVSGNIAFGGLGTTVNFVSYINSTTALLDGMSNNALNIGVGGYIWCPFGGMIRLSGGGTISVQAQGNTGTKTNTIIGGSIFSWLSIVLVN